MMLSRIFVYFLLLIAPLALASSYSDNRCSGKQVLGIVEHVILLDANIALTAKLDTGSDMSSLSAEDIQIFEKNQRMWAQFSVTSPQTNEKVELIKPIIRLINIKKRSDEMITEHAIQSTSRPVIAISIRLANANKTILCNLVDRQKFRFPMLLGADALKKFNVIVDVSQTATIQKNSPALDYISRPGLEFNTRLK
jgi:hypothetical protein